METVFVVADHRNHHQSYSRNRGNGAPKGGSFVKNCSYPIPIDIKFEDNKRLMNDDFNIYERWAGPTYSNSPPPSSLPIPTFSVQPRQSISFDLDSSISEIGLRFTVKSVPTSPSRDHISLDGDIFDSADTATENLCRILNLDITDN